jgi:hypothetical protein
LLNLNPRQQQANLEQARLHECLRLNLRYLYKLLNFFKLEHYTHDLIEIGCFTPISLLTKLDLDDAQRSQFIYSEYDRKKFGNLKLFIKKVIHKVNAGCYGPQQSQHGSSELMANLSQWKNINFDLENLNRAAALAVSGHQTASSVQTESKVSKMVCGEKAAGSLSSSSTAATAASKMQLFKKNPNASNAKVKRFLSKPVATTVVTTARGESTTGRQSLSTAVKTGKVATYQRAKSSDPFLNKRMSNLSLPSSKSKDNGQTTNSVAHPRLHQPQQQTANKSSGHFFGPKLQQQQQQQLENEISNVRLVETTAYNYGVPHQSALDHQHPTTTSAAGRTRSADKMSSRSQSNINNEQQRLVNSHKVTSEIYVFARKRPKLDCEASFSDVITIDNNSESNTNVPLSDSESKSCSYKNENNNNNNNTKSICVNEIKSTVDGTPILRKVSEPNFSIIRLR